MATAATVGAGAGERLSATGGREEGREEGNILLGGEVDAANSHDPYAHSERGETPYGDIPQRGLLAETHGMGGI